MNETNLNPFGTIYNYKNVVLSKYNTLHIDIEVIGENDLSILFYDDFSETEGGIWIEKFAKNENEIKEIAEKQISQIIKNYNK